MAKKTQAEIDAEKELRDLVEAGIPESAIEKINARAIEQAKIARPKRKRETLQEWAQDLARFRGPIRKALLDRAKEIAREKNPELAPAPGSIGAFIQETKELPGAVLAAAKSLFAGPGQIQRSPEAEALTRLREGPPVGEIPPAATVPPPVAAVQGPQPTGIVDTLRSAIGIPTAPPETPVAAPPIPLGQDPNLMTPDQNGPPLPVLGPQDLAPTPAGVPTDPVTGLPPLPGLADLPLRPIEGLPPLPPLPAESLDPAQVATPQSISLSQRMVPQATQQESQDIAEALDFISSGDPSFFDLDEGPVQEIQEGPIGPAIG